MIRALSRLGQVVSVGGLLGFWLVLLQQIQECAQLQPRDVGPAPAQLHVLKQFEQGASLRGKTGSEGPVLDGAMQMLKMAEKGQQHLGILPVGSRKATDLGEEGLELLLQSRHLGGDS